VKSYVEIIIIVNETLYLLYSSVINQPRSDCLIESWSVQNDEQRFFDKFMMKMLAKEANVIYFVFSLVEPSTIQNVITWYEEVNRTQTEYYPILVGTGLDKYQTASQDVRNTLDKQLDELAQKMNAALIYTFSDYSTCVDLGVGLLFSDMSIVTPSPNAQIVNHTYALRRFST
jgi:hypothetical protein